MLKINGTAAPTPSALRVTIEDISAQTERNAAGNTVMDFTGVRRQLKLKWAHLTVAQLQAILLVVNSGFFEITYPDPMDGADKSIECYCANRSMGVMHMREGIPMWTEIEMEWIER